MTEKRVTFRIDSDLRYKIYSYCYDNNQAVKSYIDDILLAEYENALEKKWEKWEKITELGGLMDPFINEETLKKYKDLGFKNAVPYSHIITHIVTEHAKRIG